MTSKTKRKKKILHVLHAVGGVEVYLRLLSKNIDNEKFELISINQKDPEKAKFVDIQGNHIASYEIPIQREINIIKDFKCLVITIKVLFKEKPDIIHAHSAKGGIIARAATLFYRVPVLHTPHAYSYLSAESEKKRQLFLFMERMFRRLNSFLLATSDSERKRGLNDIGYEEGKAYVFNNCIEPIQKLQKNDPLVKEFNLPAKYICTVGRPSFQKNIEMMVEVVSELKKKIEDIHLVVLGVGEYSPRKEAVTKKIIELGLEHNITLINWIERERILSIINGATLYVSTSRYEGLPYSIIESLALAKACIVTECDGNIDLVQNGINGYVIDQGNIGKMVDRVEELYSNEKIRKKFENASLEIFNQKFNIEKNISILEAIYQKF